MVECLSVLRMQRIGFVIIFFFETHEGSKWREPIFAFVFEGVLFEFT